MSTSPAAPASVNGWTILLHPLFRAQVDELTSTVEAIRSKDPVGYRTRNASKRLAAIAKLAFEVIPQDPSAPEFRLGNTLGPEHRHWFRAKFFQQYRLFFRFDARSRVIIYAWVNDEETKRAFGSKSDAYATFTKMLGRNKPPDDWKQLLTEASAPRRKTPSPSKKR